MLPEGTFHQTPKEREGAQCPRSIAGNCTAPGFAQPMGHRAPLPPRDCGLHALGKFCADQGRQTRGAAAALQTQPLFRVAKLWESVNPSVKQEGRVQRSQRWQCTCSLHNSCKIKCIYLPFFFLFCTLSGKLSPGQTSKVPLQLHSVNAFYQKECFSPSSRHCCLG